MADSSWDNGGTGAPPRSGLPLWGKIALGCGISALVVLGTCVGGVAWLAHKGTHDPEGLKQTVLGFALDRMKPEWNEFRAVIDQLRTVEGSRALYAANPDLARTWPTEADFLKAAAGWRPHLAPTPELTPDLMERQGLRINSHGGKMEVGWSPRDGRAVYVTFGPRPRAGEPGARRVLELEVR